MEWNSTQSTRKSCFIVHGAGRPLLGAAMVRSHDLLCHVIDWDTTTTTTTTTVNYNSNIKFVLFSVLRKTFI